MTVELPSGMPEANPAESLPAPEAGETSNPNLTVLPAPESARGARSPLHRAQLAELSKALTLCTTAQRPEYSAPLATRGIDEAFVNALMSDIQAAQQKGRKAVENTSARKDATQSKTAAANALVGSLRIIQSAARQKHLPDHPNLLDNYHVGEPLDQSSPLLEAQSQNIINQASEERPPGVDTDFIERVQSERQDYLAVRATQSAQRSEGKMSRAQRDVLVKTIKARRKQIQYAADGFWPAGPPVSAQARSDFHLPARRPYSY